MKRFLFSPLGVFLAGCLPLACGIFLSDAAFWARAFSFWGCGWCWASALCFRLIEGTRRQMGGTIRNEI